MTTMPTPTAETPLLSPPLEKGTLPSSQHLFGSSTTSKPNNNNNSNILCNSNEHELHFYNPATILDISREVAFAYLILLTGGAVEYVPPTLTNHLVRVEGATTAASSTATQQQQNQPQSQSEPPTIDHQGGRTIITNSNTTNLDYKTASLAYAAIVDGNVLHACFGLKITPNGRVSIHHTTNKNFGGGVASNSSGSGGGSTNRQPQSSYYSILCCFPLGGGGASSPTLDALHLVLSNLSSNRSKMHHLVEILREVREMHIESSSIGGVDAGALYTSNCSIKTPLHLQVIHAYIHCFTSIVRYHDAKQIILCNDNATTASVAGRKKKTRTSNNICTRFVKKLFYGSGKNSKITNPMLEQLRTDTLNDIGRGFHGLKEDIWESLEKMATETSFTGCASLEESTLGGGCVLVEQRG
jgi:hypothetical protein